MLPIPWLENNDPFPTPTRALKYPNGLLCAGADLSPQRLIDAYRHGIFPWYSTDEPILWWSPEPRCIFVPAHFQPSRSLRKHIRQHQPSVSFDRSFGQVMYQCSRPEQGPDASWISDDIIAAYTSLHELGIAHSIEVWQEEELIGGLYGLAFGRCFFGESMFSGQTNGSKIALTALCTQLKRWGYAILDCQVENPHLRSLGARLIDRRHFLSILDSMIDEPPAQTAWIFDADIFDFTPDSANTNAS